MILEKFVLNGNANFKYKNSGDNVIFSKGVTFGTKVDSTTRNKILGSRFANDEYSI